MPKYEIKPGLPLTTVPGVGVVKPGDILEGDYDRFVPGKLRRVRDAAPVAAAPKLAPPSVLPGLLVGQVTGEDEEVPSMEWKKAELAAYAGALGLDTEGTKADILERIEELYQG